MPSERDIEKRLRDYAEQRRKDAGAPTGMHPVTRRLLQDEVARVHGNKPAAPLKTIPWHKQIWLRLGLAAGVGAVLVAVFFGLPKTPDQPMQLAKASTDTAPQADRITSEPAMVAKKSASLPAAPVFSAPAPAPAVMAPNHAQDKGEMNSRALSLNENLKDLGKVSAPGNKRSDNLTVQPEPLTLNFTNAPLDANDSAVLPNNSEGGVGNIFGRANGQSSNRYTSIAPAGEVAKEIPLSTFQVQQNGDKIRVVDHDGSVYNGGVVPALATVSPDAQVVQQEIIKAPAASPNQTLQLNAEGWNVSLKQKIALKAQLIGGNAAQNFVNATLKNNQATGADTALNASQALDARLVGTAVLANGQQIKLDSQQMPAQNAIQTRGQSSVPAVLRISARIEGSDRIKITATEAHWEHLTQSLAQNVTINGMPWPLKKSKLLKNTGATRFLPDGVDLSTARVIRRQGRDLAAIWTEKNAVWVTFADSPDGADDYKLEIAFGTK